MSFYAVPNHRKLVRWIAAAALWTLATQASAGMFDDEEARRAILDLRQKVDNMRRDTDQRISEEARRQAEEVTGLRRSLLDLQNQLEANAADTAKIRGQNEQLARDLADAQRRQSEAAKALEDRLEAAGIDEEWARVLADLDRFTHVDVEKEGKRFRIRSSTSGCAGKVLQAVGVAAPSQRRQR